METSKDPTKASPAPVVSIVFTAKPSTLPLKFWNTEEEEKVDLDNEINFIHE